MIKQLNSLKSNTRYLVILFAVVLLIISRSLSFIPNFTPTISLIVFISIMFRNHYILAFIIVLSQLISDYFLGYYSSMFFVYLGYVSIAIASKYIFKELNFIHVIGTSCISVLIFYLISNYGVWQMMDLYQYNFYGLMQCYIAGIPFLKYSLISTLLYSTTIYVLFKFTISKYLDTERALYK